MLELVVVMPVYNEEECIAPVVASWRNALGELGIDFRIIVLNDGSKDGTRAALQTFADDERIEIINKSNSGHGPTILLGYQQAVDLATWVFQCDSDDEMPPDAFAAFWNRRHKYDALFAIRGGREQPLGRKIISAASRITVRVLFGRGVKDVNVPYRLMRSDILREIIVQIPDDTFAPNVMIAGAIARAKLRLINIRVPYRDRRTGAVSILKWKLWKVAFKSFWQTLRCRPTLRRK